METIEMVEVWRQIILGEQKSWVLFENGTCVILMEPEGDLAAQATEILREYGPVHVGSPAADFGTIDLEAAPGWVVYGHHDDVLNYVSPDEIGSPEDVVIGLLGRSKRDRDGHGLTIVHVEDKRPAG
ncbi:hypothetical protein [Spirillospora sp. NPDC047279]|uniref:hypothetical protein n=1 Tax=Spirillospora sp. NPDC047279 TaxID=3155478 RepID=UPI0033D4D405